MRLGQRIHVERTHTRTDNLSNGGGRKPTRQRQEAADYVSRNGRPSGSTDPRPSPGNQKRDSTGSTKILASTDRILQFETPPRSCSRLCVRLLTGEYLLTRSKKYKMAAAQRVASCFVLLSRIFTLSRETPPFRSFPGRSDQCPRKRIR